MKLPEGLWSAEDERHHAEEHCSRPIDVMSLGDASPRLLCGCGEASRHTALALAHRELDEIAPLGEDPPISALAALLRQVSKVMEDENIEAVYDDTPIDLYAETPTESPFLKLVGREEEA